MNPDQIRDAILKSLQQSNRVLSPLACSFGEWLEFAANNAAQGLIGCALCAADRPLDCEPHHSIDPIAVRNVIVTKSCSSCGDAITEPQLADGTDEVCEDCCDDPANGEPNEHERAEMHAAERALK